jgi:hypothetical protein
MGQTVAEEAGRQGGTRPELQIVIHTPGGGIIQIIPQRPGLPEPAPSST